jgi:hypothetical protein
VKLHARIRIVLAWSRWLVSVGCCAAFGAVLRPRTLAVAADAVFWIVSCSALSPSGWW